MEEVAIGIDLGTTHTVTAHYSDGKLNIVEDSEGCRLTPSFVLFKGAEIIVGATAKSMAKTENNIRFGIYDVKPLIKRKYNDKYVQDNIKNLCYKITKGPNDYAVILLQSEREGSEKIEILPEEVGAHVLRKVKENLKRKFGKEINKIVLTVPAHFTTEQREATLKAAKKADLKVLKLLNEPTAAALRYFYEKPVNVGDHVLVFDLGGGTFDLSILRKTNNGIDVVGVNGNNAKGGRDIDNILSEYVCEYIQKNHKLDPHENIRQLRRFKQECEEVKKKLSEAKTAYFILEYFTPNLDLQIEFTVNEFNEITQNFYQTLIEITNALLDEHNLETNDIKQVILVGGATRTPYLRQMLYDLFGENKISHYLNPDECVAEGAALQAAMILKHKNDIFEDIKIKDVVPLSIGTAGILGEMIVEIKRNTPIPTVHNSVSTNLYNNQEDVVFHIYEGERANCKYNRHLGTYVLKKLTPAPPRQLKITLKMEIDNNGILKVSAKEEGATTYEKPLELDYVRGLQNDNDIKNAPEDAKKHKKEDDAFRCYVERATYLRKYCNAIIYNLERLNLMTTYSMLADECYKVDNEIKKKTLNSLADIESGIIRIKKLCGPLLKNHKLQLMPQN